MLSFSPKYLLSGAGLDMMDAPESSDEDSTDQKPLIPGHLGEHEDYPPGAGRGKPNLPATPVNGKKTKGRVKIKMEFIDNKLRRYTTFSKRKTGIMKKVKGCSIYLIMKIYSDQAHKNGQKGFEFFYFHFNVLHQSHLEVTLGL